MMPPSGYAVPAPAGQPERPGTVTAASGLLYLLALVSLVSVALTIYSASFMDAATIKKIYEDAGLESSLAETTANAASIGVYIGAVFPLLIGVLYVILGVFVGRGKQWARITTWVIAGIAVCCNGFGLLGNAVGNVFSGLGNTPNFDQESATKAIQDLIPGWLTTASMVLGGVSLIAAIVVIILLALPPSNPYFRKAEPQWTPPTYPAP